MAEAVQQQVDDSDVVRVSDVMVDRQRDGRLPRGLRKAELWLLIDAPRWAAIVGLAATIFVLTVLVGTLGPASVQQYLLDGTAISDGYIELQPGVLTMITIVWESTNSS
jgi:hypothetical protein